ncbi:MAG: histidine phosphatase family protein [Marinobacter sp.]|uniref:histidine phosphatase family protein n=1 Tax=Marinobacter sp. TaxID=50741 RepID=UPI00299E4D34|nr:histidine phosphatase family protein [Marinobacter sp.]MDX1756336.1 histidine phosphatase family protein [Marinobacter sp.]
MVWEGRELLLLRHGKSDWSRELPDFDRPLKKRGRQGAQRIGAWLQQEALVPDYVLSSPAERARQTADLCCKALGMDAASVHPDRRLYLADTAALRRALARVPDECRRVLLVGHNPGLEELLLALAEPAPERTDDGKLLTTATLAHLRFGLSHWHNLTACSGELVQLVQARSLDHRFPFPHAHERQEWRPRPAYYYHQAAAIPYRYCHGRLEILLTGSGNGKHWRLPQGVVAPGRSEANTARDQALAQGGVVGEIQLPCLGYFRREKWGADCEVAVYGLEVVRVLEDAQWPEAPRGRQWLEAARASQLVRQPGVGRLITKLARLLA